MTVILEPSVTVTICNILPPIARRRNFLCRKLVMIFFGFRIAFITIFWEILLLFSCLFACTENSIGIPLF